MTAFSGIKFFNDDVLNKNFGGSFSASSASGNAINAFNGDSDNGWQSENENNDSTTSYIERILENSVSGDTIIISNHNLKNFSIYLNDTLVSNYTAKTENGFSVITFNSIQNNILKIKISASQTVVANSEKQVGNILFLNTIGQFIQPQEMTNKLNFEQSELTLQGGKKFVLDSGKCWEFEISIFSLNQADINLISYLRNLKKSFYIWPCGGNIEQFDYSFEPFKFDNLIKVSVINGIQPNLKDNKYWSGLRDKIKLVEVE